VRLFDFPLNLLFFSVSPTVADKASASPQLKMLPEPLAGFRNKEPSFR